MMKVGKAKALLYSFLSVSSIVLLWQVAAYFAFIDTNLVPGPVKVCYAISEWAKSGDLFRDFSTSIWRGISGLLIGSAIGIFLGMLTGRNQTLNLVLTPLLNVLKAFPPVAMLPVFITFFGVGNFSKVFSISFAAVFPLWVNTHLGSSSIPVEFIRSAGLLSKSKTKILFGVIIPASMSSIVAGFRISIAISFIMLYVSELAGASSGIGYQISSSQLAYRMDKMFGALIILGITAASVDYLFNWLIKLYYPWVQLDKKI